MGQKVNPHGLRVGVIKDWDSKWYAEADFADNACRDYRSESYLKKKCTAQEFPRSRIERASDALKIIISPLNGRMIIGKGGSEIRESKSRSPETDYQKSSCRYQEIKEVDREAQLVAENIAQQLETVFTSVVQ